MKDVSADDSADGFDNTSLKKKHSLRVKRKDQLARAIIPSTFSLVKQLTLKVHRSPYLETGRAA